MSYTPTEWSNGDVITAEKLNKLENGVSNNFSPLICHYRNDAEHLDTTVGEIYNVFMSGRSVIIQYNYSDEHKDERLRNVGTLESFQIHGGDNSDEYWAQFEFSGGLLNTSTTSSLNELMNEYPFWAD